MDKESVVLGCGCEVFGDEAEELKQRFRLLRLLIGSTALSMPLLWDLPPRFQFVLATVLQFWPGLYFVRNAVRGLKNRILCRGRESQRRGQFQLLAASHHDARVGRARYQCV